MHLLRRVRLVVVVDVGVGVGVVARQLGGAAGEPAVAGVVDRDLLAAVRGPGVVRERRTGGLAGLVVAERVAVEQAARDGVDDLGGRVLHGHDGRQPADVAAARGHEEHLLGAVGLAGDGVGGSQAGPGVRDGLRARLDRGVGGGGQMGLADRRAAERQQPTVLRDGGRQAVAEDRLAADPLDPEEVVDSLDVLVVTLELEGLEVGLGEPERVVVGIEVLGDDPGGLEVALAGEVAVEALEDAHRAGGAVDVEDRLPRDGGLESPGLAAAAGLAGRAIGGCAGRAGLSVTGVVVATRLGGLCAPLRPGGLARLTVGRAGGRQAGGRECGRQDDGAGGQGTSHALAG